MTQHKDSADLGTMESLLAIVARLRAPKGCPWDREQTHASMKSSLLEECHEVLDAIESGNIENLTEELGDVLFQVVFHAQMAHERGDFGWGDIVEGISRKLIRRHPHVFDAVKIQNSGEVQAQWDQIKKEERGPRPLLEGIPLTLPALAYSQLMQGRAARAGFDWDAVSGVWEKLGEELTEFQEAIGLEEQMHELGDVFMVLTNLARKLNLESEEALRQANKRFTSRFSNMERLCAEKDVNFHELSPCQIEELWAEAKHLEANQTSDHLKRD